MHFVHLFKVLCTFHNFQPFTTADIYELTNVLHMYIIQFLHYSGEK